MLVKNKTFWIATVVFLLIGGGIGWLVFPRAYHSFQEKRATDAALAKQIDEETQFIATVRGFSKQGATIDSLNQKARELLPTTAESDLLALQLEGLLSSLGLGNFSITVPLSAASGPTVNPAAAVGNNQSFTVAGSASFTQLENLLSALKKFGRWNKISSFEITESGTGSSVTVVANVFTRSATPTAFDGKNQMLLDQASALFKTFNGYTTAPNAATEGNYGRSDPFAAAK